jgi:hydroxyacylglutathione hydrolase
VPIHGGSDKVEALSAIVKDGDSLSLGDMSIKCLSTPCHTQDSICYHVTAPGHPGAVFTGDTLFAGGCGRFFEGTGPEMHAALTKLGKLDGKTVVYNGHEYTASNAKFGLAVDPENAAVKKLVKLAEDNKVTAGLSTIADEHEWNVFMRLTSEPVLSVRLRNVR